MISILNHPDSKEYIRINNFLAWLAIIFEVGIIIVLILRGFQLIGIIGTIAILIEAIKFLYSGINGLKYGKTRLPGLQAIKSSWGAKTGYIFIIVGLGLIFFAFWFYFSFWPAIIEFYT